MIEQLVLESLARTCIDNVGRELHKVVHRMVGMGFSHYEIERFCRMINAVGKGLQTTFPSFDKEDFFVTVYGDYRMDFESGRMLNVTENEIFGVK